MLSPRVSYEWRPSLIPQRSLFFDGPQRGFLVSRPARFLAELVAKSLCLAAVRKEPYPEMARRVVAKQGTREQRSCRSAEGLIPPVEVKVTLRPDGAVAMFADLPKPIG